jgi:hypothetical protein
VPDINDAPKAQNVSANMKTRKLGVILYVNAAREMDIADKTKAVFRPKKSAIAPEGISRITIMAVK